MTDLESAMGQWDLYVRKLRTWAGEVKWNSSGC